MTPDHPAAAAADQDLACLNCGAAVAGHYCPMCGQSVRQHAPSAAAFLHEFIGHHVAFEGKLAQTLGLLLLRPGRLTADYLAGRRVRFIEPLRLYLTLSVLFFALLKYGGMELARFDDAPKQSQFAADVAHAKNDIETGLNEVNGEDELKATLRRFNPHWAANLGRFEKLSGVERSRVVADGMLSFGPYAMFCLLPLFALYLKVLYLGSGRRYGEHILFALHVNAFAFILFMLVAAVPAAPLKALLFGWLVAYLPLAMRRVYGGGRLATVLRWGVLMTIHMTVMVLTIMAVLLLSVVH